MHIVGLLFVMLTPQPVEQITFNVILLYMDFNSAYCKEDYYK